jgi:hypothetical protein
LRKSLNRNSEKGCCAACCASYNEGKEEEEFLEALSPNLEEDLLLEVLSFAARLPENDQRRAKVLSTVGSHLPEGLKELAKNLALDIQAPLSRTATLAVLASHFPTDDLLRNAVAEGWNAAHTSSEKQRIQMLPQVFRLLSKSQRQAALATALSSGLLIKQDVDISQTLLPWLASSDALRLLRLLVQTVDRREKLFELIAKATPIILSLGAADTCYGLWRSACYVTRRWP